MMVKLRTAPVALTAVFGVSLYVGFAELAEEDLLELLAKLLL